MTASAEVHLGELDGRAVAVKVRRPGLDGAVALDLGNCWMRSGRRSGGCSGRWMWGRRRREARERWLDDLDLEHAGALVAVAARAGQPAATPVTVPAVMSDLSAPTVPMFDLLDGPTLASRPPDDPGAVARALIAFTLGAPRAVALAPADPRAENVGLLAERDRAARHGRRARGRPVAGGARA